MAKSFSGRKLRYKNDIVITVVVSSLEEISALANSVPKIANSWLHSADLKLAAEKKEPVNNLKVDVEKDPI